MDQDAKKPGATPAWGQNAAGSGSAEPYHIWKPRPLLRSILWKPATEAEATEQPSPMYETFIVQKALDALFAHVWASPHETSAFGFLVGDLCECPDSGGRYIIVNSAVASRFPLKEEGEPQISPEAKIALQLEVDRHKGVLVGWYHSHPEGSPELSPQDLATHQSIFKEAWHTAILVVTDSSKPAGAVFRHSGEGLHSQPLPFYEQVSNESLMAKGRKRTRIDWHNCVTEAAIVSDVAPRPDMPKPPDSRAADEEAVRKAAALEAEAAAKAAALEAERVAEEEAARVAAEAEAAQVAERAAEEESAAKAAALEAEREAEAARVAAEAEAAAEAATLEAERVAADEVARKAAEEEATRAAAKADTATQAAEAGAAEQAAAQEAERVAADEVARKAAEEEATRAAAKADAATQAAEAEAAEKAAALEAERVAAEEAARKAAEEEASRVAAAAEDAAKAEQAALAAKAAEEARAAKAAEKVAAKAEKAERAATVAEAKKAARAAKKEEKDVRAAKLKEEKAARTAALEAEKAAQAAEAEAARAAKELAKEKSRAALLEADEAAALTKPDSREPSPPPRRKVAGGDRSMTVPEPSRPQERRAPAREVKIAALATDRSEEAPQGAPAGRGRGMIAGAAGLVIVIAVLGALVTVIRSGDSGALTDDAADPVEELAAPADDGQVDVPAGSEVGAVEPVVGSGGETDVAVNSDQISRAGFEALGDNMLSVISAFYGQALRHDQGSATCADLQAAFISVEDGWISYNVEGKSRFPERLTGDLLERDERLYAGVQDVEREFDRSGCERP
ncbi:MAG: Mov34/MPN/PAD-1 family protein [Gemmatimonadota bacterium]